MKLGAPATRLRAVVRRGTGPVLTAAVAAIAAQSLARPSDSPGDAANGPGALPLAVFATVLAGLIAWRLVQRLLAALPADVDGAGALLHRLPSAAPPSRPADLSALEAIVLAARDSERAADRRLRPRLAAVVAHEARQRGIDPARQPERVAEMLGPFAPVLTSSSTIDPGDLAGVLDRLDAR
ncbi:MAG: hypothetical protein OEY23_18845 [Acidimicrobiia bacterium]|nr:hypothetical protein [Acidimicrobiia bacterium]